MSKKDKAQQLTEAKDGLIWLDGEMLPWQEARVHVLTHTLHYGMGVFEGIRAYKTKDGDTAIFRLQDHIRRLFDSAKIMNMKIPFGEDDILQACCMVVANNGFSSAYIRPMCFLEAGGLGLHAANFKARVMVAAWPWGSYLGQQALDHGIRVKTSSFVKPHVNSTMCKAKANGHYINSMMALNEVVADGYDEALLLDTNGFVAEGSGENIFMVRNGSVYTPETSVALEGITRDTIITLLDEQGVNVVEKRITRDEIYTADEAFFTGTAAEVTPIRELDGRTIGKGGRGQRTASWQQAYFDQVHGRVNSHPEWRHKISAAKSYARAS
ncbi:MAG: branched-chain amino acid transaminase [Candidatus Porifericomitaceae bacterium WSBS_2022_MAG_OTU9]